MRKQALFIGCFMLCILKCLANSGPSAQGVGELLGYPGSEIIVEDITDKERTLWSTPTGRERRKGVPLPDANSLIASYRITGKKAFTFYPMLIWVGTNGTFLNSETQRTLDLIALDAAKPVSKGGRGPFGHLSFGGVGEGGIYLGKVKVLSEVKEMSEPQEKVAMISVLNLPSRRLDLKIAFMANLEGGSDLFSIPGGERYFESFRPSKEHETEVRYNVAELFQRLHLLVAAESYATAPSQALAAPSNQVTANGSSSDRLAIDPNQTQSEQGDQKQASAQKRSAGSAVWAWLVFVVIIVGATVFLKKRRKPSKPQSP